MVTRGDQRAPKLQPLFEGPFRVLSACGNGVLEINLPPADMMPPDDGHQVANRRDHHQPPTLRVCSAWWIPSGDGPAVPEPQGLGSPFLIKTPRHLGLLSKWRLRWRYPVPKKPGLQLQQPLSKLLLEEDLCVALALTFGRVDGAEHEAQVRLPLSKRVQTMPTLPAPPSFRGSTAQEKQGFMKNQTETGFGLYSPGQFSGEVESKSPFGHLCTSHTHVKDTHVKATTPTNFGASTASFGKTLED
ncbi:uncharacterized protein PITG_12604 [Phytophthora infestans T30-4]|uniref:Uncharacterized protein n=1 Tax=Phytophthora infestans (strain T30-4) TaxID=403677 RepID=D0NND6_PHYIT|nr:uncharacterized protein PITG_12604 [Phytophthora infestans T30-4]EEY62072.1 hypothetical protein PITG_12604 [Phytophthora infestans T30-4]|eukprot:XP_002899376.1 hypothetical protein PITG_12604 [Phytophthora infestans T30-4]